MKKLLALLVVLGLGSIGCNSSTTTAPVDKKDPPKVKPADTGTPKGDTSMTPAKTDKDMTPPKHDKDMKGDKDPAIKGDKKDAKDAPVLTPPDAKDLLQEKKEPK